MPRSSRDDGRGREESERDSKRSRRSGFDDAPPAQAGGAVPGLGAPPPPAGVIEADFSRAVKEAAARAASIMAAHGASAGAPPGLGLGGHGEVGYPPAPQLPGGYAPPGGAYGAPPGGGYGAPPPAQSGGYPMPLGGYGGAAPMPYGAAQPPAMAMGGGYGAPPMGMGGGSEQEVLTVNPDACGKIIGRGGETISQLQQQTGANIKVQSASEVAFGQPRRVTISGTAQAVAAAKRIIEVRLGLGLSCCACELFGRVLTASRGCRWSMCAAATPAADTAAAAVAEAMVAAEAMLAAAAAAVATAAAAAAWAAAAATATETRGWA